MGRECLHTERGSRCTMFAELPYARLKRDVMAGSLAHSLEGPVIE